MTETTPNIKDRVAATTPKVPRNTKKSTTHDAENNASKADKKAAIAEMTSAIIAKGLADSEVLGDELYSDALYKGLKAKREAIEAFSFAQLQGKARQKTAHVSLSGSQQLQLAGSNSEPEAVKIFACEDWLGDDDDA